MKIARYFKRTTFLIFSLGCLASLQAQTTPCSQFNQIMADAKSARDRGDYRAAIDKYFAAKACNPEDPAPDIGIKKTFDAIDALRKEALAQKKEANRQRAMADALRAEADRNKNLADSNALISRSGALSSKARLKNAQGDHTVALQLTVAAAKIASSEESTSALADIVSDTLNASYTLEINAFKYNIFGVAFSPAGNSFAATWGKGARVWNLDGVLIHSLDDGHLDLTTSIAFSPDGRRLLTGGLDNTVRLWDSSGVQKEIFLGHQNTVSSVAFSPKKREAASGSTDRSAIVWDLKGNILHQFKDTAEIDAVAFSPSGDSLLTGSRDGTVKLWSITKDTLLNVFSLYHNFVSSVAFSPDGQYILSGSLDGGANLTSLSGDVVKTFLHNGGVSSVAFSPDGVYVLTAGRNQEATLWDRSGARLKSFVTRGAVSTAGFSPDGLMVVTGGADRAIRIWDPQGPNLQTFRSDSAKLLSVSFNSDNGLFYTADDARNINVWNDRGKKIHSYALDEELVRDATFSRDGRFLLTIGANNAIGYWTSEGKLRRYLVFKSRATTVEFSPDGQWILMGGKDFAAHIWDTTGRPLYVLAGATSTINVATASRDLRYVATGSDDDTVRLYAMRPGQAPELIQKFNHKDAVRDIDFSPSGDSLLTADKSGMIKLWNTAGDLLQIYQRPFGVRAVAFSPDGTQLLSGDEKGFVCLWGVGGEALQSFKAHQAAVSSVAFSKDGRLFLSGGEDRNARLLMRYDDYVRSGKVAPLTNQQKVNLGLPVSVEDFLAETHPEKALNDAEFFADAYNFKGKTENLKNAKALYNLWLDSLLTPKTSENELKSSGRNYFIARINSADRPDLRRLYLDCEKRVEDFIADPRRAKQERDVTFLYDEANRYKAEVGAAKDDAERLQLQEKAVNAFRTLYSASSPINNALSNSDNSTRRSELVNIRSQLAGAYGSLAYYQAANKKFQEAIVSAQEGLRLDSLQTWIVTNLALGYLFSGQTNAAEDVYQKYKNKPWTLDERYKTMREAFLADLDALEAQDITTADVEKIRYLLNNAKE